MLTENCLANLIPPKNVCHPCLPRCVPACLQVSEEQLVSMLEQINEQSGGAKGPKITMQRRRCNFDDDDE